jgi:hypothetical protein
MRTFDIFYYYGPARNPGHHPIRAENRLQAYLEATRIPHAGVVAFDILDGEQRIRVRRWPWRKSVLEVARG